MAALAPAKCQQAKSHLFRNIFHGKSVFQVNATSLLVLVPEIHPVPEVQLRMSLCQSLEIMEGLASGKRFFSGLRCVLPFLISHSLIIGHQELLVPSVLLVWD